MAYINREQVCENCNNKNCCENEKCPVYKVPTADVVPKSEYERLNHKYELAVAEREANVKGFTEELAKAKSEVAREIFEEIENFITNEYLTAKDSRDIEGYVKSSVHYDIAELKKKYTESEDKP